MSEHNHSTSSVEYREIPRFPGNRFGSDGSVWSRWMLVDRGKGNGKGCASVLGDVWKPLSGHLHRSTGYRSVKLKEAGQTEFGFHLVHRVILEAFVGPCPDGLEACHGTEGQTVNAIRNLRWDTRVSNIADRDNAGNAPCGERNAKAKLKEADIPAIFRLFDAGMCRKDIAEIYGVSAVLVGLILNRKIWKHIPIPGHA